MRDATEPRRAAPRGERPPGGQRTTRSEKRGGPHAVWRPGPLLVVSAVVHVAAVLVLVYDFGLWPWVLAALVIDHAAITVTGLLPRSHGLGANLTQLPAPAVARREVALTIDDGPDLQVTPAVLDLLDAHGAKATFFCVGQQAARHPALCREIVRRGHAIENHSQHHRHNFSLLGPGGFRREIQAGQDTLRAITGVTPAFFRAPAGLRNPFLDPVLQRLGLRLASWTRRAYDTRNGDPAAVVRILTRGLRAGDILLLHDRHGAKMADGRPVILGALPDLLHALKRADLHPVTLKAALR